MRWLICRAAELARWPVPESALEPGNPPVPSQTSKQSVEQRDVFDAKRLHALQEERKAVCAAADLVEEGLRVDVNVAYGFQNARQLLVANICSGLFDMQQTSSFPRPVDMAATRMTFYTGMPITTCYSVVAARIIFGAASAPMCCSAVSVTIPSTSPWATVLTSYLAPEAATPLCSAAGLVNPLRLLAWAPTLSSLFSYSATDYVIVTDWFAPATAAMQVQLPNGETKSASEINAGFFATTMGWSHGVFNTGTSNFVSVIRGLDNNFALLDENNQATWGASFFGDVFGAGQFTDRSVDGHSVYS